MSLGEGRKLSMMTRPLVIGPSCTLIGVISMPIMVPPNIFGVEADLVARPG